MTAAEKSLRNQINFLLSQLRDSSINIHQFMKLLDMTYKDYLDFYPEERPEFYGQSAAKKSKSK